MNGMKSPSQFHSGLSNYSCNLYDVYLSIKVEYFNVDFNDGLENVKAGMSYQWLGQSQRRAVRGHARINLMYAWVSTFSLGHQWLVKCALCLGMHRCLFLQMMSTGITM